MWGWTRRLFKVLRSGESRGADEGMPTGADEVLAAVRGNVEVRGFMISSD